MEILICQIVRAEDEWPWKDVTTFRLCFLPMKSGLFFYQAEQTEREKWKNQQHNNKILELNSLLPKIEGLLGWRQYVTFPRSYNGKPMYTKPKLHKSAYLKIFWLLKWVSMLQRRSRTHFQNISTVLFRYFQHK